MVLRQNQKKIKYDEYLWREGDRLGPAVRRGFRWKHDCDVCAMCLFCAVGRAEPKWHARNPLRIARIHSRKKY